VALKFVIIPVTHYQQNTSLLWCTETMQAAVVDPGDEVERILQRVKQVGVTLTQIFLTHGHMDHVGGARALAEALALPIIGPHKEDAFWLDQLPEQALRMGFTPQPPLKPTRWLQQGDTLTLGHETLQVLHCPGHTPGHVVFYHVASFTAWVGDVLFAGSIGRSDFPRGHYETLVKSIREQLWPLGDAVQFVPGHGPMSSFGEERRHNPFVADKRFG
jgi:hydroxyacylglutathione hydrolase